MIKNDPDKYYKPRMNNFYKRSKNFKCSDMIIKEEQEKMLNEISLFFKQQNCNYKIIISPDYQRYKFNSNDLILLNKIFGKERVFDFSGNNPLSDNIDNFYEPVHYRPTVSRAILSKIY